MATSNELNDILRGIRELPAAIPAGEVQEGVKTVLHLVGHAHKGYDAEDYDGPLCVVCDDEWPCRELTAVLDLARAVMARASDERARVGNGWVI